MKKTFLIIILLGLIFTTVAVSAEENVSDTKATVLAAKFAKQLNILNKVTVDDSIFQNQAFRSLQDWKVQIPSEAKGRANPFAPL